MTPTKSSVSSKPLPPLLAASTSRTSKPRNVFILKRLSKGCSTSRSFTLINALEITGKKIGDLKVVVSGAGASAIACAEFYVRLGVKREKVRLVDTRGVVYVGRKDG